MAITGANLELRYSGGASNSNPTASIGGVISSAGMVGCNVVFSATITGVTPLDASTVYAGVGELEFEASTFSFRWKAPGSSSFGPDTVADEDGGYSIEGFDDNQSIQILVDFSSLPVTDQNVNTTITYIRNNLFADIDPAEALAGSNKYRALYLYNNHPTETIIEAGISIGEQTPGEDNIRVGAAVTGVGNGSSTGVIATVANENTAPAGVTFSTPSTDETRIILGDLAPGECVGFWVHRECPAAVSERTQKNRLTLRLVGIF